MYGKIVINTAPLLVPEAFLLFCIILLFLFYISSFIFDNKDRDMGVEAFFFTGLKFAIISLFITTCLIVLQFNFSFAIGAPVFFFDFSLCIDLFSICFKFFITLSATFILTASSLYFSAIKFFRVEYIIIFLIFILAAIVGLDASDFLSFYVSLELQSLCVYILLMFNKDYRSVFSGTQYFFYSIFSAVMFVFGVSYFYISFGSINYFELNMLCGTESNIYDGGVFMTLAKFLIFSAILFKFGVFPYQFWVAGVYGNGFLPTVFALATVSKIFAFGIFGRFLFIFSDIDNGITSVMLYWIGIVSIIYGVFGAFFQVEIRRILAYSAVAHIGYVFLMFSFSDTSSFTIATLYFFTYIFSTFFIFYFLITVLMYRAEIKDNVIQKYSFFYKPTIYLFELVGISKSNWVIAFFLATLLFSYAGIPPFFGFYAKYFVFYYLVQQGYYGTFFFCFFFSVLSSYYYLSIVASIYFKSSEEDITFVPLNTDYIIMFTFCIVINFFAIFFIDSAFSFISNYLNIYNL